MEGEGEMLGLYWGLFFGGELLGNVLTFWFGCNFFVVEGETVFFCQRKFKTAKDTHTHTHLKCLLWKRFSKGFVCFFLAKGLFAIISPSLQQTCPKNPQSTSISQGARSFHLMTQVQKHQIASLFNRYGQVLWSCSTCKKKHVSC